MRSLKTYGKAMIRRMILDDYYLINETYIFKYSGIGLYPNTNEDMLTGKGNIVNVRLRTLYMCDDPEEKIGIIDIKKVHSVQLLTSVDIDLLLNNPEYEYNQI